MERDGESEDQGFLPPEPAGPEPELGDRPPQRATAGPQPAAAGSAAPTVRHRPGPDLRLPAASARLRLPAASSAAGIRPASSTPYPPPQRSGAIPSRPCPTTARPWPASCSRSSRWRPARHLGRPLDDRLARLRDRRDRLLAQGQEEGRRGRDAEAPRPGAGGLHHRLGQPRPLDPGHHRLGLVLAFAIADDDFDWDSDPNTVTVTVAALARVRDSSGADAILGRSCRIPTSSST